MNILKAWAVFRIRDSKLFLHALGVTSVILQGGRKISPNDCLVWAKLIVSCSHSLDLYRDR